MADDFHPFKWTSSSAASSVTLAGHVAPGNAAEWEWARIQNALGILEPDHKFLKRNLQAFEVKLECAEAAWPVISNQLFLAYFSADACNVCCDHAMLHWPQLRFPEMS